MFSKEEVDLIELDFLAWIRGKEILCFVEDGLVFVLLEDLPVDTRSGRATTVVLTQQ